MAVAFAVLLVLAMVVWPVTSDRSEDCGQIWSATSGGPYTYANTSSSVTACKEASRTRLLTMATVTILIGGSGVAGVVIFRPKSA